MNNQKAKSESQEGLLKRIQDLNHENLELDSKIEKQHAANMELKAKAAILENLMQFPDIGKKQAFKEKDLPLDSKAKNQQIAQAERQYKAAMMRAKYWLLFAMNECSDRLEKRHDEWKAENDPQFKKEMQIKDLKRQIERINRQS